MNKLFEQASRDKIRFSYRGQATPEDLWDIPLEALDSMHMNLRRELEASQGASLLRTVSYPNKALTLKIDLIAHVVETRLAEQEARQNKAVAEGRKQQILSIVQRKQDNALEELPIDELLKLVN